MNKQGISVLNIRDGCQQFPKYFCLFQYQRWLSVEGILIFNKPAIDKAFLLFQTSEMLTDSNVYEVSHCLCLFLVF